MQKHYDVTALGELLIDFTENGVRKYGYLILFCPEDTKYFQIFLCSIRLSDCGLRTFCFPQNQAYRFYRESWKRSIWQIVEGNH